MFLLLLLVHLGLLLIQAHPIGREQHGQWALPKVVQTTSDNFYLYLPKANHLKVKVFWEVKYLQSHNIIFSFFLPNFLTLMLFN